MKTILSYFFQRILLPLKVTFTSSENIFSTNPSFRLVETYFMSRRNSVLLFGPFFLVLETMIEIMKNQFEHYVFFLLVETYLSSNVSFRVAVTDFLASTNHKLFFPPIGNVFFNESFILAIGKGFFH